MSSAISSLVSTKIVATGSATYNFSITALVKDWLKDSLGEGGCTQDYGFIMEFVPSNGLQYGFKRFGANGHATPPSIVINYNEDISMTDGIYMLKNVANNKYFDVLGGGTANGTQCIRYAQHGGFNQQWQVKHLGSGTYVLRPMHVNLRGKALEVYTTDGTPMSEIDIQSASFSSPPISARWKLVRNNDGTGSYRLLSLCSDKRLCVSAAGDNDNLYQYHYLANGNDQWVFERFTYTFNTIAGEACNPNPTPPTTPPTQSEYRQKDWVFDAPNPEGYIRSNYTGPYITGDSYPGVTILENSSVLIANTHGLQNGIYGWNTSQ